MKLLIAGGAIWKVGEIFEQMVELAGGRGSRIGVIPLASGSPYETWNKYRKLFEIYGAKPIIIDITEKNYREKVCSKEIVEKIINSNGIFFTGGIQRRIIEALIDENEGETPALKAIRKVYLEGRLIAGSSAGAAVMSNPMIYGGLDSDVKIGRGLGFLMDGRMIVDQHFIQRGRLTRLIEALRKTGVKLGIGIDEETAMIVEDGTGKIIGKSSTILLERIDEDNFRLTYLSRGDEVDLDNLDVKVSRRKKPVKRREGRKKYYIIDLSTPRGIYMALKALSEMVKEHVEAYVLRLLNERGEVREGYAYRFRLERKGETEFFEGEDDFEKYQRLTAINVYLHVERKPFKIIFK